MATGSLALDGLRVLDLTSQLSGPYCAMLLGDLGADVIKIERPGVGDDARAVSPKIKGESAAFMTYNRNKRSVTLDLKAPAGRKIALALAARARTGLGQHVDTSLLETPIAWSIYEASSYFATGEVPARLGPGHRASAPYQAFRTKDSWINLGGGSPGFWPKICALLGVPELVDDPRFRTPGDRVRHRKELEALLQPRFEKETTATWLDRFEAEGVPAGPILTYDQVFADPQVAHREMAVPVDHPVAGRTRGLGIPIKRSGPTARIRRPAPTPCPHP